MKYLKISNFDTANGLGIGNVLWVSGCSHHCPQCHNPQTWDKNAGEEFTEEVLDNLLEKLKRPYIKRLTLSGGDPLFLGNRDEITNIVRKVKKNFPNIKIWCYTGYLWEEVKDLPCMDFIDVLVDGEFKVDLKDITLPFCGSSNQRIINVKESLKKGCVVLEEIC